MAVVSVGALLAGPDLPADRRVGDGWLSGLPPLWTGWAFVPVTS